MAELQLHPLCTLFPRMGRPELLELAADIVMNGQREPIITLDGMILDGGNRYQACIEAGVEPETMKFGAGNPVDYVLSANLHRRHLSAGQRAAIVSSCQNWAEAHPPHRTGEGCNSAPLTTKANRSKASGASKRTQTKADKVAKADPTLAKDVAQGTVSLDAAVDAVDAKAGKPARRAKPHATKPEPVSDELAGLREANAEQGVAIKELLAENESMGKIIDADDKLKVALAEAKKFREQVRILDERVRGLQNECNEAKRAAKSWQAKFLKLEKQCKPT